jgi:hypothetical protein
LNRSGDVEVAAMASLLSLAKSLLSTAIDPHGPIGGFEMNSTEKSSAAVSDEAG